MFDVTNELTNRSTWTSQFFLPSPSSFLKPLYIYAPLTTFCRVYNVLLESRQTVYRETAREGGREEESVSGFQLILEDFIGHVQAIPAQVVSLVSYRPPSPSSPFFRLRLSRSVSPGQSYLQVGSQKLTLLILSGYASPHSQDGLYNRPFGLPTTAADQLGAGGSIARDWWGQSARGALLSGASISGYWRNGEVLVPLHLSIWNHLFSYRCSRNRSDLHL